MKNIKYIAIVFIGLLTFSSCQDILDTKQNGVDTIDSYYSTDSELKSALASIYYLWNTTTLSRFYLLNLPSDDMYAGGKNRGANHAIENVADFEVTSNNTHVTNYYNYLYQMIYRANCILEYSTVTTDYGKQAAAEAHFIRAWAHFELAVLWGKPPLVDHVLTPSEYLVPNSNKEELWKFIIDEFKTAVESGDLLEKDTPNSVVYNITKGYAQAMLGKAYVFSGDYDKAITTLESLISEGKYELYDGDYCNIIAPPAEFNKEILFELNSPEDPNNALTAHIFQQTGWRNEHFDWTANTSDVYEIGWGQANPTKDLYDAFVAVEGENGYRLNNTILTYPQVVAQGVSLKTGHTLEQHDGYFSYKHRNAKSGRYNNNSRTKQDFVFMRYAEVLLLAAEAHIQSATGDKNKAADYINDIRTRARVDKDNDGNIDFVSASDPNLFQLLKDEKRLELCYEGCRIVDLIRWGDAYEKLKDKSKSMPSFDTENGRIPDFLTYTTTGFKEQRNELLPYPMVEINVNTNLVQNPGY